jgi:hypothetical protein
VSHEQAVYEVEIRLGEELQCSDVVLFVVDLQAGSHDERHEACTNPVPREREQNFRREDVDHLCDH